MTRVEDWLFDFLAIDSLTGDEAAIFEMTKQRLGGLDGFSSKAVEHSVAFFGPSLPGRPKVGLFGHLDTVANQQDFAPQAKDGRIYGCGASDMKAGLAVMATLMEDIAQGMQTRVETVFVFYDQEEGPYEENGLGPLLEGLPELKELDLALVLEPTNCEMEVGCMGGLHAQVSFMGRSAHSARPWQGKNAIHMAAGLLNRLAMLEPKEINQDGLTYFEVINATLAEATGSRNSIPECFSLNLNYRFAPGKSMDRAKRELEDFIGEGAKVQFTDACPAGAANLDHPILKEMIQRHDFKPRAKQAWTDIARLAEAGIPAVNFGPGESSMAHQKNEWVDRASLARCLKILTGLLKG